MTETPNVPFDTADLKAVIESTDHTDGPGIDNVNSLPESNFVSFATDHVEEETK